MRQISPRRVWLTWCSLTTTNKKRGTSTPTAFQDLNLLQIYTISCSILEVQNLQWYSLRNMLPLNRKMIRKTSRKQTRKTRPINSRGLFWRIIHSWRRYLESNMQKISKNHSQLSALMKLNLKSYLLKLEMRNWNCNWQKNSENRKFITK